MEWARCGSALTCMELRYRETEVPSVLPNTTQLPVFLYKSNTLLYILCPLFIHFVKFGIHHHQYQWLVKSEVSNSSQSVAHLSILSFLCLTSLVQVTPGFVLGNSRMGNELSNGGSRPGDEGSDYLLSSLLGVCLSIFTETSILHVTFNLICFLLELNLRERGGTSDVCWLDAGVRHGSDCTRIQQKLPG